MASETEDYLAVLKAAYDYEPQPDAEDELAIKENQLLLLLERTDEEYVALSPRISPPRPTLTAPLLAGGKSKSRQRPRTRKDPRVSSRQHTWNP